MKRFARWFSIVLAAGLFGPPLLWALGGRGVVMRWGTAADEATRAMPGDELIPSAQRSTTRALTIDAPPEAVFPWLTQIGAGRAGFYSHVWIERAIGCEITNGEAIEPAWQLKAGDVVRLCPEGSGPPLVYVVKALSPPRVLVLAVEENGTAATTWAFELAPIEGRKTRLLVRNRTGTAQSWQELIEPGVFVMEHGMMRGLAVRATRPSG
ncbi:MAG: hypothetical protein SFW67_15875 [Myxococcaceae bacterium]|nr:hypothetical protein [Myxococcaceae bacterium]